MHFSKISFFTATCFLIVLGMLAVSCSDDDNPAAPPPQWSWAPLGTGISDVVYDLAVYFDKLVAGGPFIVAGGVSASHIAA